MIDCIEWNKGREKSGYGLCPSAVSRIMTRANWSHIP